MAVDDEISLVFHPLTHSFQTDDVCLPRIHGVSPSELSERHRSAYTLSDPFDESLCKVYSDRNLNQSNCLQKTPDTHVCCQNGGQEPEAFVLRMARQHGAPVKSAVRALTVTATEIIHCWLESSREECVPRGRLVLSLLVEPRKQTRITKGTSGRC